MNMKTSTKQLIRRYFTFTIVIVVALLSAALVASTSEAASATTADANRGAMFLPFVIDNTGFSYYVAPNGNDNNPGTLERPFRSIQKAVDEAGHGDTVFLRGGVYVEEVVVKNSGRPGAPLTIRAYPGERPIIDGEYRVPADGPGLEYQGKKSLYIPLLHIKASHVVVDGLEVRRSQGRGIEIGMRDEIVSHVSLTNCSVHDIRNRPIGIRNAQHVLVENCDVYHGSDFATHSRSSKELPWSVIVASIDSQDVTFRGNRIHENWGEGLVAGRGSSNVLIENNEIYDNYALQVYVQRARNVVVQRNLIYHTGNSAFWRGGGPSQGIVLENETAFADDPTVSNVDVINNLVIGCRQNVNVANGQNQGLPINNVVVAHNTLINAFEAGIKFNNDNPSSSVWFHNNIVYEAEGKLALTASNSALRFGYNGWNRAPEVPHEERATGEGDVYGNLRLVAPDAPLVAGQVDVNNYRLTADSAALGAGKTGIVYKSGLPGLDATRDFFGRARDAQPDLGMHEYD